MGNLVTYVKADTVNIPFPYPVGAYLGKILDDFRMIRVKLRHTCPEGKRIITCVSRFDPFGQEIFLIDKEPVVIRGSLLFLTDILPGKEVRAAMVENTVQHNADTGLMSFLH